MASGAPDKNASPWRDLKSSHNLPTHRQSQRTNKGEPAGDDAWGRWLRQICMRPDCAQTVCPFGWASVMAARTNAAMARSSLGTCGESRNLMKYTCPLSLTRSSWQLRSSARILVQMKTSICRRSGAVVCSSFKTYGKIPTDSAKSTAHGPMSRNRPSSTSARSRCDCDSSTCSTIGSCSGGGLRSDPCSSQTSNAVSCSVKKGLGANSTFGSPATRLGSCSKQISTAMSHACHIGCWYVGGSAGHDMGVQLLARMIRSANKKLRNSDATSRSCRNSLWNSGCGRTFHAIVSVMAVKIQFSSPSGVFLLFSCPGILSMRSMEIPSPRRMDRWQNHRSAILIGVVRHELNTSAGSSADCGRSSSASHAASRMVSWPPAPRGMMPPIVASAPPPTCPDGGGGVKDEFAPPIIAPGRFGLVGFVTPPFVPPGPEPCCGVPRLPCCAS
mmetsp:Transcript_2280/g.10363  ORF Transcript_2280/g.10363 Transcript_2280/m.10363 type:complete len:444 (-) Transcript_2280:1061-2392(-)